MATVKIALDKSSTRRIDADGRLHVDKSHISKSNVSPYYGVEIPGYEQLGLQPKKIYYLFRDPVELERGAHTFARLPILSEHIPITVADFSNDDELKKLVIGAIGSDVSFSVPYLDADLVFWDADAIAGIDSDTIRELSCAYRYVPVMEPGEYDGEKYDGRMTEIQGNHLALVEIGRAGSDVIVADQNPFKIKEPAMKMSKLGKALFTAIGVLSPKLAADSAFGSLVGNADRKTFKPAEVKKQLLALDTDLDPNQLDQVVDSMVDLQNDPEPNQTQGAADEGPADKVRALLPGVSEDVIQQICSLFAPPAADADPDSEDDKDGKPAMDAAIASLRSEFKDAAIARDEVDEVVGKVIGMDSATEIYGFALDHMKVDRKGVEGTPALRALFKVAAKQYGKENDTTRIAADHKTVDDKFPALKRFG